MNKRYEITIRELTPLSEEEVREEKRHHNFGMDRPFSRYADKPFHEVRVLSAEVSKEEFEAIKKAAIGVI